MGGRECRQGKVGVWDDRGVGEAKIDGGMRGLAGRGVRRVSVGVYEENVEEAKVGGRI